MALVKVEVAYASVETQRVIKLEVEENTVLETVIDRSGILEVFPEIDLTKQKIGVFGKIRKLSDVINAGDRIEIYRPLLIDPKQARREKAKKIK